jgi:hypothetical protein
MVLCGWPLPSPISKVKGQKKTRLSTLQNSSPIKKPLILKKCRVALGVACDIAPLKFCVVLLIAWLIVSHRDIPGCCCSSFWADMSTLLGAWVLVNAKALGPQEGSYG